MKIRKLTCAGLIMAVSATLAVHASPEPSRMGATGIEATPTVQYDGRPVAADGSHPMVARPKPGLTPRVPVSLPPQKLMEKPAEHTGRLVMKFGDATGFRADRASGTVITTTNFRTDPIQRLQTELPVRFVPAFSQSRERVAAVRERAQQAGQRMHADFNAMCYVTGPEWALEAALRRLLLDPDLDRLVEYAHWDERLVKAGGAGRGRAARFDLEEVRARLAAGEPRQVVAREAVVRTSASDAVADGEAVAGPAGACCLPNGTCQELSETNCVLAGGNFFLGSACTGDSCGACCSGTNCFDDWHVDGCGGAGEIHFPNAECTNGVGDNRCEGACCMGAMCDFLSAADCDAMGGTYFPFLDCNQAGCDAPMGAGACCLPPNYDGMSCMQMTQDDCVLAGGAFWGEGVMCTFGDDNDELTCDELDQECGSPQWGCCFNPDGTDSPYCSTDCGAEWTGPMPPDTPAPPPGDDGTCCELICEVDPFCCDTEWDYLCSAQANAYCPLITGPDRCAAGMTGSCFEQRSTGGCSNADCCNLVTFLNPGCGEVWDISCVFLARELCADADADVQTPDLTVAQGYLQPGPWDYANLPMELFDALPRYLERTMLGPQEFPFLGFNGEGMQLEVGGESFDDFGVDGIPGTGDEGEGNGWFDEGEPWDDDGRDRIPGTMDDGEGNGIWDKPEGLRGLSEELFYSFGINRSGLPEGQALRLTNGFGTNIGVVGEAFWLGHEDLTHVVPEPGQTMIDIEEITDPDHDTAVLGILGAKENNFGVTGVAHDADLFYFPVVSVEEGERLLSAYLSALESFGPGDLLVLTQGLGGAPFGNLNNEPGNYAIFEAASDLGITVCVPAGNGCFNLDDADDLAMDGNGSGAIVVGSCTPGAPYYRLDHSNFYTQDPPGERSNVVHVRAWGAFVATCGYGDAWNPDAGAGGGPDNERSYTYDFGGTAAAAAQVAGLAACLQGLSKQFFGIPLAPRSMRDVLMTSFAEDFTSPDPARGAFRGTFEGLDCGIDSNDETGEVNELGPYVGNLTDIGGIANTLIESQLSFPGATGFIREVHMLRGEQIFGNEFSVKSQDFSYLVAGSFQTDRGFVPGQQLPQTVPNEWLGALAHADYFATGQIVDTLFVGRSLRGPTSNTIAFTFDYQPPPGITLNVFEVYDWNANEWAFGTFDLVTAGGFDQNSTFVLTGASRLFGGRAGVLLARHYAVSFGDGGTVFGQGASVPFQFLYDRVDAELDGGNPLFGSGIGGGGGFGGGGGTP